MLFVSIALMTLRLLQRRQQSYIGLSLVPYRCSSSFLDNKTVSGFHFPALNTTGFFAGFFCFTTLVSIETSEPSTSFFTLRVAAYELALNGLVLFTPIAAFFPLGFSSSSSSFSESSS